MRRALAIVAALSLAIAAAGCGSGANKAGGGTQARATRVLTLANVNIGTPRQLTAFIDQVERLSGGTLRIEVRQGWRPGDVLQERHTLDDVRAANVDMAWVGARVFDSVGVTSFQALLAPLLVDSYPLEGRVFAAGIPQQMLAGVSSLGVVGIAVLPGPLRRVFGVSRAFVHPADFAGQVVATSDSELALATFRALGAVPRRLPSSHSLTGFDAADTQLDSITGNGYATSGSHVSLNLDLWPRPLVVVMNERVYRGLTSEQRRALSDAAANAISPALAASRAEDVDPLSAICRIGASIDVAPAPALAAMRSALQPVYDELARYPRTKKWLDRIVSLKEEVATAADSPSCSTSSTASVATESGASAIDGLYEVAISREQWIDAVGIDPAEVPSALGGLELRIALREGRFRLTERPDGWNVSGRYAVEGDRLALKFQIGSLTAPSDWQLRWSLYHDELTLEAEAPTNPRYAPSYWVDLLPWHRVREAQRGDFVEPHVRALLPDGVYRFRDALPVGLRDGKGDEYATVNATLPTMMVFRHGHWWFPGDDSAGTTRSYPGTYRLERGELRLYDGYGRLSFAGGWSFTHGELRWTFRTTADEIYDFWGSGSGKKIG